MWRGVTENISMRPGRRAKAPEAHISKSGEIKVPTGTGKAGVLREFSKKFSDSNVFTSHLQDWLHEKLEQCEDESTSFPLPFQVEELRQLDYALEGVMFQQLLRMPPAAAGPPSALVQSDTYLAVEDFLHASAECLWETFWSTADLMPFYVSGPRGSSSKIHSVEKASGRGRISALPGVALIARNGSGGYMMWDHIAQFVEVKSQVAIPNQSGTGYVLTPESLGCAIFHGLLMLLNRASSDKKSAYRKSIDTAYIVVLDSKYGGVLKLKGDVSKLEMNLDAVYTSAAEWVLKHAEICLSSIEIIWNKLGNPNWGDLGTLQLLMAVFHCIEQFRGTPRRSIAELAAEHNGRVQRRKTERRSLETQENGIDPSQQHHSHRRSHREIVEIEEEEEGSDGGKSPEHMKLEPGTMLWLEDAHWQRGFQIHEDLGGGRRSVYAATSLDDIGKPLAVYVGAHPSQLEPSWEDMSMWYQVQRQTRVLNIMKQRGISSKYLPQLIASGRLMHPGPCTKKSPGGRCDHPWCGTPVLVTSPVGESLDLVIEREGFFSSEEALRCCHDILSALRSSASAGIQHGDINPEHVIRANGADGEFYYVLVDWGRAVLEDRDSPAIAPRFSSTSALQEGKLCPASDAESLVYLLYFVCGGKTPEFDTMEAALQWRERVWARRAIQQQLGEVSAVLKAFADYVDSLCGTPYPVDYDIWLRRLSRALHHDDPGKKIEYPSASGRLDYVVAESSGTSGASVD